MNDFLLEKIEIICSLILRVMRYSKSLHTASVNPTPPVKQDSNKTKKMGAAQPCSDCRGSRMIVVGGGKSGANHQYEKNTSRTIVNKESSSDSGELPNLFFSTGRPQRLLPDPSHRAVEKTSDISNFRSEIARDNMTGCHSPSFTDFQNHNGPTRTHRAPRPASGAASALPAAPTVSWKHRFFGSKG